jgi:hypothetical protein
MGIFWSMGHTPSVLGSWSNNECIPLLYNTVAHAGSNLNEANAEP